MPVTAEEHCARISLFEPIMMQISRRKRKLSKRSRRHTQKCATRHELTSWFTCVTLSVLYCLFGVLLTKFMDVENNPGPDENFVTLMQNVDWRFSQIMQGIQMHTAHINSKMDEKFGTNSRSTHSRREQTEAICRQGQRRYTTTARRQWQNCAAIGTIGTRTCWTH